MDKPFFSIVMPIYGVEKYLADGIDSVLNQTEQDFEIILVDDCSPDNSGKICDEYAQKDDRIKVLHLEQNGGLSNARNKGFENVTGEFVFFMDSDDTIDEALLEKVKCALEKNRAQVTVFGIHEEYFDENNVLGNTVDITFGKEKYFDDVEELRKAVIELEKKTLYGYAWNKIYDVEYLKKIGVEFKKITLIEDIMYNVEVFTDITKLNVLEITPYNYKKRLNASLTNKFVKDYYELHKQRVEMILNQYKTWNLCDDNVKKALADIYARYIFSALQRNCDNRSKMTHKDRKEWLKKIFFEELWLELSPYLTLNMSLQGILSRLLKMNSTILCLSAGRFIYIVKEKLPMIFSMAKVKRGDT